MKNVSVRLIDKKGIEGQQTNFDQIVNSLTKFKDTGMAKEINEMKGFSISEQPKLITVGEKEMPIVNIYNIVIDKKSKGEVKKDLFYLDSKNNPIQVLGVLYIPEKNNGLIHSITMSLENEQQLKYSFNEEAKLYTNNPELDIESLVNELLPQM